MKRLILLFSILCLSSPALAQEIKCGYAIWNPVLFKDINTNQIQGISYDVMEAAGKRLNLKINWAEESAWGTIIEGLMTHRYDAICTALGAIPAREKVIDFSKPIFYLPVYIVVRADDKRFDGNQDLINSPDIKIGVLEGEGSSIIALEKFPKAKTVSIPQMSDYTLLLEDIRAGKSDVSFITTETFQAYDKKNPGKLRIANEKPLSVVPVAFGLPKDDAKLKGELDKTIDAMKNDGSLKTILHKYDPSNKIFLQSPVN